MAPLVTREEIEAQVRAAQAERDAPPVPPVPTKTTLSLPKEHLSVSQVDMYRRCPKQYYFRYVKDMIRPPNVALTQGKSVHAALAVGHIEYKKNGNVPLDQMHTKYEEEWNEGKKEIDWTQGAEDDDDAPSEASILETGHQLIKLYHEDYLPKLIATNDETAQPYVEKRFEVLIGEHNVPLLGFIDLVATNHLEETPRVELVDHKVVGRAKSQGDVDGDFQLSVYSKVTGVTNVRFNSLVKSKRPSVKSVFASRTSRDWAWAEQVIEEVALAISAGVFPPGADGWHCGPRYCGYYTSCRGKK